MCEGDETMLVEFIRVFKEPNDVVNAEWRDQNCQKYKGEAQMLISDLLKPGVTTTKSKAMLVKTRTPANPNP